MDLNFTPQLQTISKVAPLQAPKASALAELCDVAATDMRDLLNARPAHLSSWTAGESSAKGR